MKRERGEADFLLFHPEKGFLILEVKGGLITCENGRYYSVDRKNKKHPLKRSPLRQAKNSMYFIRDLYKNKAKKSKHTSTLLSRSNGGYTFPLSYNSAILFTDCEFQDRFDELSLPRNRVFDRSDLREQVKWKKMGSMGSSPFEEFITGLLDIYKHRREPNPQIKDFFTALITPKMNTYINIKHYCKVREEELERINLVQDYLIDALSEKQRCMFRGSAGSGKTFIAMKKAIRLYKQNKKTLFICFNKELRYSIEQYLCEQLRITPQQLSQRIEVTTLNTLMKSIGTLFFEGHALQEINHLINTFKFQAIGTKFKSLIPSIPESQKVDAILIDEAQDIHNSLCPLFLGLLREEKRSILYVFFDKSQDIFTNSFTATQFGMDPSSDMIVLNRNLRNTTQIAKWTKKKTKLGIYSQYSEIEGPNVRKRHFPSGPHALKYAIAFTIQKYFAHGIRKDQVIILSNEKLKSILSNKVYTQHFSDFFRFTLKSNGESKRVFVIEPNYFKDMDILKQKLQINGDYYTLFKTIQGFKGLERDIIFLLLNTGKPGDINADMYVGATRAKFKLHVYTY